MKPERQREKKLRQALWRTRPKRPEPGDAHIKIGSGWRDGGFKINYTSPTRPECTGLLDVDPDKHGFHVGVADVASACRSTGVGTLLYEIAAREACTREAPHVRHPAQ